jgi:hypothetical protein
MEDVRVEWRKEGHVDEVDGMYRLDTGIALMIL